MLNSKVSLKIRLDIAHFLLLINSINNNLHYLDDFKNRLFTKYVGVDKNDTITSEILSKQYYKSYIW